MSFLALKLNNTERLSYESDYQIDRGLGLFSGLNVLPKVVHYCLIHIRLPVK